MSNNVPNNGLGGFLQRIGGWITAVIGFLTTLIGFIKLVQGDVGFVTKVLLTFGIVVLWLTCAYFYWKPAPKVRTAGFTPPTSSKQRKQLRRLALAGIIAIPIVTATGFYGWQQYQSRPSDQIIVLVAEFKSLQPEENYAVTESIIKQLRLATKKYSDVKIQPLKKPITEQEGSEVARKEGKKSKASIVIWGWYGTKGDKVPISANFEVLNPPKELPEMGQIASGRVQTPAIAELKSFTLQTRLSNEMAYLSLFTLGMTRYTASKWDEAVDRFSDALSQIVERTTVLDQSIVYLYRGNAYGNKGEYDRAIADYNQAIKLNPDYADAYYFRGNAYYDKGEYDLAIADYNQAIKLNPIDTQAYNNRGNAYGKKGDHDLAIADYNQAIKLNPIDTQAYNNRGNTYGNKGEYDLAIANYSQAIKLNPNYTQAYNNRGVAYYNKGKYDRAVADFSQALKLQPNNAEIYNGRGWIYAQKGDYDRAIADANQALKLQPDAAPILDTRGFAYAGKGDYNRALADYNQALKLDPKADYAYLQRGIVYRKQGKKNQAIADFKKALELTKDSEKRQDAEKQL